MNIDLDVSKCANAAYDKRYKPTEPTNALEKDIYLQMYTLGKKCLIEYSYLEDMTDEELGNMFGAIMEAMSYGFADGADIQIDG